MERSSRRSMKKNTAPQSRQSHHEMDIAGAGVSTGTSGTEGTGEDEDGSYGYDAPEDEVSVASSLLGQHHPGVGASSDPLGLFEKAEQSIAGKHTGNGRRAGRNSIAYLTYKEQQAALQGVSDNTTSNGGGGGDSKGKQGKAKTQWTHAIGEVSPQTVKGKSKNKASSSATAVKSAGQKRTSSSPHPLLMNRPGQYIGGSRPTRKVSDKSNANHDEQSDEEDDISENTEVSEWDEGLNMYVRVRRDREEMKRVESEMPAENHLKKHDGKKNDSSGPRNSRQGGPQVQSSQQHNISSD